MRASQPTLEAYIRLKKWVCGLAHNPKVRIVLNPSVQPTKFTKHTKPASVGTKKELTQWVKPGFSLNSFPFVSLVCFVGSTALFRIILLGAVAFVGFGGATKIPGGKGNTLERIGSWPELTRGPALDVAITDHYAYVAIGHGGLIILDVSDPTHPVRVGDFLSPGHTHHVRIEGSRAYLATRVQRGGGCQAEAWRGRLVILDISDPVNPKPLGDYVTGALISAFFVDGHQVMLRDGAWVHDEESFRILDVSDPADPVTLFLSQRGGEQFGRVPIGDLVFFSSRGHQAHVASHADVTILDIRQPNSPAVMANIEVSEDSRIQALQVEGNRLYLIGSTREFLMIFDTSDSSTPRLMGSVEARSLLPGPSGFRPDPQAVVNDLEVEGNYAYLPMMGSGLAVFDVSDSANPVHVGTWDTPGEAVGVELAQGHAFVADSHHGIQVIDVRDPVNLRQSASFDTGLTPRAVQLSENRAYLLSGYASRSRIEVLDVSHPSRPALLGTYDSDEEIMFFDIADSLAYAGLRRGEVLFLQVLDFRYPSRPESLSKLILGGIDDTDGYVQGQYAYFTTDGLLQIFDVSDPLQPERLSRIAIDYGPVAGGLQGWNNLAYVSDYQRLTIINVRNPNRPARIGSVDLPESTLSPRGLGGLSFSRDVAFVGMGFSGFAIVDSRNPNQPSVTAHHDTLGEVTDLAVAGEYLYLAEGWEGIQVFDVHDSRNPFSAGQSSTRGKALGIEVKDDHAYVVEAGAGLAIFDLKPDSIKITRNPASQSVAQGDTATLTVRAYSGQEPLGYQWYRGERGDESQPIPDANGPDFTTPPLDEEASYWVRVTGDTGVIDSQTARLRLVPSVKVELLSLWPDGRRGLEPDDTVTDVAVSGQYAFLAVRAGGLKIINVSDPLQPNLAGSYGRNVRHVAADNRYVYVTGDTMQVLDISDPTQPSLVADLGELGGDLFPNGDFAYLSDGGPSALDMRNPAELKIIPSGLIFGEWGVQGMSFRGSYAAAGASWGGVQILDLSVPSEPKYVSAYYSDTSVNDVAWRGNVVCLTLGGALPGLELVDTSDPPRPAPMARVSLPIANQVELMGSYACVTGDGLAVFDIGNTDQLVPAGSHQLRTNNEPGSETRSLEIIGNLAYVAAGDSGLAIYRITPQMRLNSPAMDGNAMRWTWLGAPGIRLQRTTDLTDPDWQDVPDSEGASTLMLSQTDHAAFFRLVKR